MFWWKVVHLPLPVPAARYPRVHGQPVIHPGVPVGVEADDADIALGPLRDGLGDGVRAARRVLPDHDGERPRIERLVDLLLDRGLRAEDVLDGRLVIGLRRDLRVAEIDHLEVLEHVEVEVLDVARLVPDGLLPDALGSGNPVALRHAGVLGPAGDIGSADDRRVHSLQIRGRDGVGQSHERGLVGFEHGEVPLPGIGRIPDRVPSWIANGCLLPSRDDGGKRVRSSRITMIGGEPAIL
jgi:hypothetical protein